MTGISLSSHRAWIRAYLYPYILRYKWKLILGTLISCALAGLNYFNLQFIRRLFDQKLYLDSFQHVAFLLGIIFAVIFLYNLMNWIQADLSNSIIVNSNKDLIDVFYSKIYNMPFLFFHSHSPGQLLTLLLRDITEVTPLITLLCMELVKNVLILAILFGYLLMAQWYVLVLYLFWGAGYLLITNYFTNKIKQVIPEQQKTAEAIHNKLIEYFQVINLLKIFDVNDKEKRKVTELNELLAVQLKRRIGLDNAKNFYLECVLLSLISCFVLIGYNLVNHGVLTAGKFVTILVASYLMNGYIKALFVIYAKVQQTRVYIERLRSTFTDEWDSSSKEHNRTDPGAVVLSSPITSIIFQDVQFKYHQTAILKKVSCTFEADSMIGITGESGYGKTTVLNLMLKLVYPSSGDNLINGISVRNIDSPSYVRQISYLPQNTLLFNGTIAENIAFGAKHIDREKVVLSAKRAGIHDFILSTPHGYDAPITTGMSTLSEGERKRIEIARALYKDSSVIILDEPTANLDIKNKVSILEVLKALENRIIIIVSHDLSALEHCDKVLLINAQKEMDVLSSHEAVYQYYANVAKSPSL